ncbi:Crp/Fnr family transcriptional regulator [Thermodesulfobacteriota bacterium]
MKCPKCQAELPDSAVECVECSCLIDSPADGTDGSQHAGSEKSPKHLSGFRRTLSTELMEREMRAQFLEEFNALLDSRTYEPGDIIIQQGEKNRDLIFVTEGALEISTEGDGEKVMLSQVGAPYILGDIGFVSGFPRTATVRAGTRVKGFVMGYDNFNSLFPQTPDWFLQLLTSFVSGIKSLIFENAQLKKKMGTA